MSAPAGGKGGDPVRRVVVGVDLEQPSLRAAHWTARTFAPEADVLLVHCLGERDAPPFLRDLVPPLEERARAAEDRARSRLRELEQALAVPGIATILRRGRVAAELAAVAGEANADLLVLGEHGPRPGLRSALGSAASQLPIFSPVPVLIKRHLPEGRPRRVLAAVDHSGFGESVLRWTRLLSQPRPRASEVIVHMALESEWLDDARRRELGRAWLSEVTRAAGLPGARIDVSTGDPRYEILAVQRRHAIDLVVVGRRGGGVATSPVIGSVANTVLHAASCSVLVV